MVGAPPLILAPTHREATLLARSLEARGRRNLPIVTCGFGLAAAGATAAWEIARLAPSRVILSGIAGTFDPETLPIGTATHFDRILLHGVGVDAPSGFYGPKELGFPSLDLPTGPVWDDLVISEDGGPILLSCAAASAHRDQARRRREHWPQAIAEDMEAFSVALAARIANVPLQVFRGISNEVGHRDVLQWLIEPALDAAAALIDEALASDPGGES